MACNYAIMQLCNYAIMQLCNYETVQLCNYATMQLFNYATCIYGLQLVVYLIFHEHVWNQNGNGN